MSTDRLSTQPMKTLLSFDSHSSNGWTDELELWHNLQLGVVISWNLQAQSAHIGKGCNSFIWGTANGYSETLQANEFKSQRINNSDGVYMVTNLTRKRENMASRLPMASMPDSWVRWAAWPSQKENSFTRKLSRWAAQYTRSPLGK